MRATAASYQQKFSKIAGQTQFGLLPEKEQVFLKNKAFEFRLTQQELRLISEMALDRTRWKERPLSEDWPERVQGGDPNALKKTILAKLRDKHDQLCTQENDYSAIQDHDKPSTQKPILSTRVQPQLGLGRCPVASESTRCCNLLTLDAVEKCGFDCSYCSIQSFYHGNEVVFDSGFADKLNKLKLDPQKTYHIGTGQSSDSLMWGNHQGVLQALMEFAERNPNVILELKTKSKNIGWLLQNPIPNNVIVTWSLNPQSIIEKEEHLSATLQQRLACAQAIAAKGSLIGFHFHPIIHYSGWQKEYQQIGMQITRMFQPDQVALVSLGTLTFTKAVMKTIKNRELTSKILQMPLQPSAGKLSYPKDIKLELFSQVYAALEKWHDRVFFYLCMEPQDLWKPVFGFEYQNNEEFEREMKSSYFTKINKLKHQS